MDSTNTNAAPGLLDRIALWAVFGTSAAIALLIAIFGSITVIGAAIERRWDGELNRHLQEPLPPEAAQGTARVDASMTTTSVTVTNISESTNAWALAAGLAHLAIAVVVTGSVAYLAWRLLERRPFASTLSVSVQIAGIALTVGSIIAQTLGGITESELVYELNPQRDEIIESGHYWTIAIPGDLLTIGFGLLLLLVAFAFRYGERLQRDTEGLV